MPNWLLCFQCGSLTSVAFTVLSYKVNTSHLVRRASSSNHTVLHIWSSKCCRIRFCNMKERHLFQRITHQIVGYEMYISITIQRKLQLFMFQRHHVHRLLTPSHSYPPPAVIIIAAAAAAIVVSAVCVAATPFAVPVRWLAPPPLHPALASDLTASC